MCDAVQTINPVPSLLAELGQGKNNKAHIKYINPKRCNVVLGSSYHADICPRFHLFSLVLMNYVVLRLEWVFTSHTAAHNAGLEAISPMIELLHSQA